MSEHPIHNMMDLSMEKIREMVDVPVALEKDGNCAAYGEVWCGCAQDLKNFITLVMGSGFGGSKPSKYN